MEKVTREDVVHAYKVYLGREPESENCFPGRVGVLEKNQLKFEFLQSKESIEKSKKRDIDILIFGNCHASVYRDIINNLTKLKCHSIPFNKLNDVISGEFFVSDLIIRAKYIIFAGVNDKERCEITEKFLINKKVRILPNFVIKYFHPDTIYFRFRGGSPGVGAGSFWNSRLILFAFMLGMSREEAVKLFSKETYEILGYFNVLSDDRKYIANESKKTNLPISEIFNKWIYLKKCFMHGLNHPKVDFLLDVVIEFLKKEKIEFDLGKINYIEDGLIAGPAWSPYPDIAAHHGCEGGFYFKFPDSIGRNIGKHGVDLFGFIDWIYEQYSTINKEEIILSAYDEILFGRLKSNLPKILSNGLNVISINKNNINPYKKLPNYQFWRRSISALDIEDVDPVVHPKIIIKKEDKVATAGSCFAQHISKTLSKSGFNYFVAETSDAPDALANNYGVYSARYGNIYSTRQLLQLFNRAYGYFTPVEDAWETEDGRLVDPFRPQIQLGGFASLDELHKSREQHFLAVKNMFEEMDIFVFTLGLTEIWRSKIDGAVFPLAPGVAGGGAIDENKYEFVNLSVEEVRQDLQVFIDMLFTVNPKVKILLTVSPVPLMATYENRHVLCSTTLSKSVLRVAADTVANENSHVDYFPSYEIITGNYSRGAFFDDDLRSVKPEGVSLVMKVFMKNYTKDINLIKNKINEEENKMHNNLIVQDYIRNAEIICDEELLDR